MARSQPPRPRGRLAALLALLALAGCGRVDELRLAHANDGTPEAWPPGVVRIETPLMAAGTGQPWIGVSVDGNPAVPFLLENAARAVAVTGARSAREPPGAIGRVSGTRGLLPGIPGGRLVHNRRLAVEALSLLDQGVLLVDESDWPHARPGGGAAGVIGYDLFRRFAVELDRDAGQAWLVRPGSVDVPIHQATTRLSVLDRRPYLEAERVEDGRSSWIRLQLEVGWPGTACLDGAGGGGEIVLPGGNVAVESAPCDAADLPADPVAGRDGILGYGALSGRRVLVDYPGGRVVFTPAP